MDPEKASIESPLLFAVSELALCVSPGPAVLYVTSSSLQRGFGEGVSAAAGIVSGNTIYFVASALGVGALILASGDAFQIIKWLSIAYLVWLGLKPWLFGVRSFGGRDPNARGRVFRGGLVVQLANPKVLVFFVAILPPFIDPSGNVPMQVLVLAVTSQVIESAVLLGYIGLATRARRSLDNSRFSGWIDRIAGGTLLGVAAALALVRRAA